MKSLAEMLPLTTGLVVEAAVGQPELQSRIYSLGIYPGVKVDVLRRAPAGDPIQVRCGNTLLSIRKKEAALIRVELLEAATS